MKYSLLLYFTLIISLANAQEYDYSESEIYRSPVRKVLNMFSLTVTTGYSSSTYSHDLSGFYYLQSQDQQFITENTGLPLAEEFDVYENWLNNPALGLPVTVEDPYDVPFPALVDPVLNPLLIDGFTVYNADSIGLGFKGKGWSIPLNMSVRFNYDRFRIGFGFTMESQRISKLEPTVGGLGIRNYSPDFKSSFFTKYYGQIGYRFYDFWDYSFAGEIEIGKNNLGGKFNKALISTGVYVNLGVSIEKNLSEYFRVIFKPSYDIRSYTVQVPGTGLNIKHKYPAFNLSVGISITFPEIPRSPIKSDHVQLKHVITDPETGRHVEVRGQPIWKKQNPKVGENHRKLWRYKNKNKKKINPY